MEERFAKRRPETVITGFSTEVIVDWNSIEAIRACVARVLTPDQLRRVEVLTNNSTQFATLLRYRHDYKIDMSLLERGTLVHAIGNISDDVLSKPLASDLFGRDVLLALGANAVLANFCRGVTQPHKTDSLEIWLASVVTRLTFGQRDPNLERFLCARLASQNDQFDSTRLADKLETSFLAITQTNGPWTFESGV